MKSFYTNRGGLGQSTWLCAIILSILIAGSIVASIKPAPRNVTIVNNQPFRIQMPILLRDQKLGPGSWSIGKGRAVQQLGDDLVFVADLDGSSTANLNIQQSQPSAEPDNLKVRPVDKGLAFAYKNKDLGQLSWDVMVRNAVPTEKKGLTELARPDLVAMFDAIPLTFKQTVTGPVFDTWSAEGSKAGLKLKVEVLAYHAGFIDLNASVENISAKTSNVYASAVCKWQQPEVKSRTLDYNNEITGFGGNNASPFRGNDNSGTGDFRHMFIQRGVDWLNNELAGETGALWLNDFAPSFTLHQDANDKRPGRYTGANSPQLGQEVITANNNLYSVTEIAKSNTRYYLDRFVPNVLPAPGEQLKYSSRIALSDKAVSAERADEVFIGYVGYGEQHQNGQGVDMSIGVPGVRFGTNYLPYSTLGENFTIEKLPGMDRAAYWPLAADTVTQWQLFADDIRRDLRIAKTMGFETIRLHHLELISNLDKKVQKEYLDFIFGELRHLGLRALVDIQMEPADVKDLVQRYKDLIDGVEIENEILIFGINDGRGKYWNSVYDAVKQVDPNMPVHLTAHTNAGAFERLTKLGIKYDKLGQHSYMDSLNAIPSARGFSLAMANYGRKVGKPSEITEWNWRGLSRMTPEARAKVYAPIFENVLKTRSVPVIYQFQLNESLAMDPTTLKGIRHYELIALSRRPKPEAFELMRLISKYSLPSNPVTYLDVDHSVVELDASGQGTAEFHIKNRSDRTLELKPSVESPADVLAQVDGSQSPLRLAPGATATVKVKLAAQPLKGSAQAKPLPGFYHAFLRLEGADGLLRYGWAEARLTGNVQMDTAANVVPNSGVTYGPDALSFNFDRPLAVVYGDGSPVQDLETATALWGTLESATGRPVGIYQLSDLPAEVKQKGALILVGTTKTNTLVAEAVRSLSDSSKVDKKFVNRVNADQAHGDWLVIGGEIPKEAENAAMDLMIRFWKNAKDAAARRVPLVEKEIPPGGDPSLLP